jgi:adenylylsulfate kinase-like enzyme
MKSNKVRVIVNGVSFFTTKAQIKRGVGDNSSINLFVQLALEECIRDGVKGLGRTYQQYDSKMQATPLNLQINL